MSTETTRSTNGRSKSPTNGVNKPANEQLTPETSDDESRKLNFVLHILPHLTFHISSSHF